MAASDLSLDDLARPGHANSMWTARQVPCRAVHCTFGLLFESLCVRDLRVYAAASGAGVFHYRDARGLECDAVEWPDGRWGAVEVKVDPRHEDDAAATLLKLGRLVRSQHGGPPTFLALVTATGFAYRGPDGVYVLPITCLGP